MVGTVIVALVVAAIVALAARSLWKNHKAGKSCGCGHCDGCKRCG